MTREKERKYQRNRDRKERDEGLVGVISPDLIHRRTAARTRTREGDIADVVQRGRDRERQREKQRCSETEPHTHRESGRHRCRHRQTDGQKCTVHGVITSADVVLHSLHEISAHVVHFGGAGRWPAGVKFS